MTEYKLVVVGGKYNREIYLFSSETPTGHYSVNRYMLSVAKIISHHMMQSIAYR